MNFLDNVMIPVFASGADQVDVLQPQGDPPSPGVFYTDTAWSGTWKDANGTPNPVLIKGVVEGIARSIDYNTIMRQCSVMSALLANIVAYRNSEPRGGSYIYNPKGAGANTKIGTEIQTSGGANAETDIYSHIGALTDLFGKGFLFDNEVITRTIQNSAVTTPKIADLNVTTAKIANNAVTPQKISSNFVYKNSGTVAAPTYTSSTNGITAVLSMASFTENGITGQRFKVDLSGTKVNNAKQADDSTRAASLSNVSKTTSNMYLIGQTSYSSSGYTGSVYCSQGVYVSGSSGNQLNATTYNALSDRRLKKNIKDLGKNQVKKLVESVSAKTFEYKSDDSESFVGFVAQDLLESNTVLADLLVGKHEDGMYYIKEDKLVYVLWDYVKQQNKRISDLEDRLAKLEAHCGLV